MKNGWKDGQTDGLTDDQRETIIHRHYCVAGYKNLKLFQDSVKAYAYLQTMIKIPVKFQKDRYKTLT